MIIEIPREPGLLRTVSVGSDAVRLPMSVYYGRAGNLLVAAGFAASAIISTSMVWAFATLEHAPCTSERDFWIAAVAICFFAALASLGGLLAVAFGQKALMREPALIVDADGIFIQRARAHIPWAGIVSVDLNDDMPWLILASPLAIHSRSRTDKLLDWASKVYFRSRRLGVSGKTPIALGFIETDRWRLHHVIALLVSRSGGTATWSEPSARVVAD